MPELIPERDGHSSADKGLEAGRSLYEDALPISSKPKSSTDAPRKLTRAEHTSSGDSHGVGLANERTAVQFKDGDTLWDLAQEKYKSQPSLGAIYQANGLTPQVVYRNGKREFLAPICYVGSAYILPAQKEIPRLESLFRQRMRLAETTPRTHTAVPDRNTTREAARNVSAGAGKEDKGNNPLVPERVVGTPERQGGGTTQVGDSTIGKVAKAAQMAGQEAVATFVNAVYDQGFWGRLYDQGRQALKSLASLELADKRPEVPPPENIELFPGSYYRKMASSWDVEWSGITAIVTLGTPQTDPNRIDKRTNKPLDGFTIYMGGNAAGQEIDAGLSWEPTIDKSGKVSESNRAWRPFWLSGKWDNAPAREEFYWHPGETVSMSVTKGDKPGWLCLTISDLGPKPQRSFTTEFRADNFAPGIPVQFKSVTALDQAMGSDVTPTRSRLTGTTWQQICLLRGTGSTVRQVPLTVSRRAELTSHKGSVIVSATARQQLDGGETIDICGLTQAY